MKMWIQDATKEDLLNVVQSEQHDENVIGEFGSLEDTPRGTKELRFLWRDDPRRRRKLPDVVIVEKGSLRDFFAWTGTYLTNCRPLSAYCRVADRSTVEWAIRPYDRYGLGRLETACLGVILGETATYMAGDFDINKLTPLAFAGTYSFAMTRCLARGLVRKIGETIGESWLSARRLTAQKTLSLSVQQLDETWRALLQCEEHFSAELQKRKSNDSLLLASKEAFEEGEISRKTWHTLTAGLGDIGERGGSLTGPREGRVVEVERALAELVRQRKKDVLTRAFVGGYLVSRIAPGTFEHHNILLPFIPSFPQSLLWYGLFAGMHKTSKLQNFSGGMGRRVLRDAMHEEEYLDSPRCDISLAELEVLSSGNGGLQSQIGGGSSYLLVEVAPCVNCVMRGLENRRTERHDELKAETQQTLFSDPPYGEREMENLLLDLENSLEAVNRLRNRMRELVGRQKGTRKKIGLSSTRAHQM